MSYVCVFSYTRTCASRQSKSTDAAIAEQLSRKKRVAPSSRVLAKPLREATTGNTQRQLSRRLAFAFASADSGTAHTVHSTCRLRSAMVCPVLTDVSVSAFWFCSPRLRSVRPAAKLFIRYADEDDAVRRRSGTIMHCTTTCCAPRS